MKVVLKTLTGRRGESRASAEYRPGNGVMWAAAALIGAMLADLAETAVDPSSSGEAADIYRVADGQHGQLVLSAYLLLASALLIFPGVYGLARGVVDRGRRFAKVAIVVSFLGALGHAAMAAAYLMWAAMPGDGASESDMVALLERMRGSAAVAPLGIGFIAFPVCILMLFGALLRAGAAPRWVLAPVIAAPVAAIAVPGPESLSPAVALVLLLVATAAVVVRIARGGASAEPHEGSAGPGMPIRTATTALVVVIVG